MSGFSIKGNTFTYISASASAVYRYRAGAWGQLRFTGGLLYRELPVTLGTGDNVFNQKIITTLGPVLSANLMRGITRKIGVQVNAQVYYSVLGLTTPNGAANNATFSYQAGLMGSLAITDSLVGFLGYAYRVENAAYKSSPTTPSTVPSVGDKNDLSISGNYINMMLEYGF
jgi:hypothetical protein